MRMRVLTFLTLLGVVVGLILGFSLKFLPWLPKSLWTPRTISYIKLPGELYLNLMRIVSVPLCVSSISASIGSIDVSTFGSVAWRTLVFIIATTMVASLLATLLAVVIRPGRPAHHPIHPKCLSLTTVQNSTSNSTNMMIMAGCTRDGHPCLPSNYDTQLWGKQPKQRNANLSIPTNVTCSDSFLVANCELSIDHAMDLLRDLVPDNIVHSFFSMISNVPDLAVPSDASDTWYTNCLEYTLASNPKQALTSFGLKAIHKAHANVPGLITFFVVLAISAFYIGETGRPVLNICTSMAECMLSMGTWVIWLAPVGLCSVMAGHILTDTLLFNVPASVLYYLLTCLIVIFIHSALVLPVLYLVFLRKSPLRFYKQILPVIGITFGSATSVGSMPVTIQVLENTCRLDPRVVRFVVPVTTFMSMDGNVITTIVGTIYVAQLHGIGLGPAQLALVILVTSVVCTGSTVSSFDGLERRMAVALNAVQLPAEFFVYVAAAEFIIIMFAAVTNALSNCVCTEISCQVSKKQFSSQVPLLPDNDNERDPSHHWSHAISVAQSPTQSLTEREHGKKTKPAKPRKRRKHLNSYALRGDGRRRSGKTKSRPKPVLMHTRSFLRPTLASLSKARGKAETETPVYSQSSRRSQPGEQGRKRPASATQLRIVPSPKDKDTDSGNDLESNSTPKKSYRSASTRSYSSIKAQKRGSGKVSRVDDEPTNKRPSRLSSGGNLQKRSWSRIRRKVKSKQSEAEPRPGSEGL